MTLFEVFDALEQTAIGAMIRDSSWLFPVIEVVHLLGLSLLGGAVLLVDLRLLGLGLRDRSAAFLVAQSRPWLITALVVLIGSGVPLFLSEAVKCYFTPAFWVKMGALATALVFTFAVRNRIAPRLAADALWPARFLGLASLSLWVTVAAAGRWIGFS